jgi:hypothetical protein
VTTTISEQIEWQKPFPVRLTARAAPLSGSGGAGQYRYSWTEQVINPDTGQLEQSYPARSGTATLSPAYELNNKQVTVPCYVWLRLRGIGHDGQQVYEFMAPEVAVSGSGGSGGSGSILSITLVTKVCLLSNQSGSGSGYASGSGASGIVVERRTFTLPDYLAIGDAVCRTNPTNCCQQSGSGGSGSEEEGVGTDCCPGTLIPKTLYYSALIRVEVRTPFVNYIEGSLNAILAWSGGQTWQGYEYLFSTDQEMGANMFFIQLICDGGTWKLKLWCGDSLIGTVSASAGSICAPFVVIFDDTITGTDSPCTPGVTETFGVSDMIVDAG